MRKLLCFAFVLATMASCGGNAESSSFDSNFRMHLRLWPGHHTDTELRDDLVGALKEYKGVFDEVWLCTEFETLSMPTHRASAKMMGDASRMLSRGGVNSVTTFVILCVAPLNILKGVMVSVLTMLLYKRVARPLFGIHR